MQLSLQMLPLWVAEHGEGREGLFHRTSLENLILHCLLAAGGLSGLWGAAISPGDHRDHLERWTSQELLSTLDLQSDSRGVTLGSSAQDLGDLRQGT